VTGVVTKLRRWEGRLTVPATKNGLQVGRLFSDCPMTARAGRKQKSDRKKSKYEDAQCDGD